jgi:hypothetical protein
MQATRLIGCLAVALLAVPIGARAAESEAQRFQQLEERMRVLEDKLAASSATIEAQQELIQRAQPDVAQGVGMDAFFNKLEVSGGVTGSYLYNFNQPGITSGTQPLNQFNKRHNEFSFDAAKFELSKTAAAPGEAGFALDLLYGQNGDILRGASPTISPSGAAATGDSDLDVFVQEAYASYNMGGVTWKLGKFVTLLGYEVLDSYKNPNVTHGLLFTWAIPLYHTGLLATGSLGEGVSWSLGMVDGFNNVIENNDGKAYLGQIAMTQGGLFGSLSAFIGTEGGEGASSAAAQGSVDDWWIFDAILSYSLSDQISFWINADLGTAEDVPLVSSADLTTAAGDEDPEYWGVAVGSKFQMTEKVGFAIRGEYFEDDENVRNTAFGLGGIPFGLGVESADVRLYSLTGTMSYALANNLKLRGEVRWDHADNDVSPASGSSNVGGDIFPKGKNGRLDDESILGIVEVSYIFD